MNENAIALVSTSVPAHVKEATGRGNENITRDHLQPPRVKLLQQLSNEVEVKENHLTIEGSDKKNSDDPSPEYVYKGIARRSFERKFILADTLHVEDVTFKDGILRLVLKQEIPEEQKPKTIKIN